MGFFDDAIGLVGQGLAQSAAGAIGGTTGAMAGQMLGSLFASQTTGGENLGNLIENLPGNFNGPSAQLTMLQTELTQEGNAIAALGTQLSAVASAVQEINGEIAGIESMLKQIQQEQLYTAWALANNPIDTDVVKIETTYALYAEYVAAYATTKTKEVKQLATSIVDPNEGEATWSADISSALVGTGGEDRGLLELWSDMVTPLVLNSLIDYRVAVDQYFAYYARLTWAQLRATNLLMEAHEFRGDHHAAVDAWNTYRAQLLTQEDPFIQFLVPLVAAAVPAGRVSGPYGAGHTFTFFEAAMQLHPGVQATPAEGGHYAPSSVFLAAEDQLAKLYVNEPKARRMAVHVLYSDYSSFNEDLPSMINAAKITIEQGSTRVAPTHSFTTSSFPNPFNVGPDQNWADGNSCNLKRLVYSVDPSTGTGPFADGTYQLTDLNGQEGLVPLDGYLGKANFQEQKVLDYVMEVNAVRPFDFMNFGAYMPGMPYATT